MVHAENGSFLSSIPAFFDLDTLVRLLNDLKCVLAVVNKVKQHTIHPEFLSFGMNRSALPSPSFLASMLNRLDNPKAPRHAGYE